MNGTCPGKLEDGLVRRPVRQNSQRQVGPTVFEMVDETMEELARRDDTMNAFPVKNERLNRERHVGELNGESKRAMNDGS